MSEIARPTMETAVSGAPAFINADKWDISGRARDSREDVQNTETAISMVASDWINARITLWGKLIPNQKPPLLLPGTTVTNLKIVFYGAGATECSGLFSIFIEAVDVRGGNASDGFPCYLSGVIVGTSTLKP